MAQLVKNLPAVRETWVQSLGWEDPLEKGKATHSSILALKIPWTSPWGPKELDTTEQLSFSLSLSRPDCSGGLAFLWWEFLCGNLNLQWLLLVQFSSVAQSCLTLCDPTDKLARLLSPWDFPGNTTGVGCHFLLQGIFLTQGSNPSLLHSQVDSLPLSHLGSPPLNS